MAPFRSEIKDQMNLIYCPEMIDAVAVKQFLVLQQDWLNANAFVHVFDFALCSLLDSAAYRPLIAFKQTLVKSGKRLFSINLSAELRKQISLDGLDAVFQPEVNLDEVLRKTNLKKTSNSDMFDLIKPFIGAVQVALATQANTPLTKKTPYVKKDPLTANTAIAGVITLNSDRFNGSIALMFPEKIFFQIYENMLGEKISSITKESEDLASELLNIIFGLAKAKLNNEGGHNIKKAIPTVLVGENLRVGQSNIGLTVVLPFDTSAGEFYVEVTLDKS